MRFEPSRVFLALWCFICCLPFVQAGEFYEQAWDSLPRLSEKGTETYVQHVVRVPRLRSENEIHTDFNRFPWSEAAMLTGTLDIRSIRTTDYPIWAYLFYDHEALWLGYRCEAQPGDRVKVDALVRDGNVKKDTNVEFYFDPGVTRLRFFKIFANPAGVVYDASKGDSTWNADLSVKAVTDEKGWSVAMRVPFEDLGCEEPKQDTEWGFNYQTSTGTSNSWAALIGGYHYPEGFGRLVFGGKMRRGARLLKIGRAGIGANFIQLEAPKNTRYRIDGISSKRKIIYTRSGELVSQDRLETIGFNLENDQVRRFNVSLRDKRGKCLVSFWLPVDTPSFSHRLPEMEKTADDLHQALGIFPQETRPKIESLLDNLDELLRMPIEYNQAHWKKRAVRTRELNRGLTDAWLYAQTLERLSSKASFGVGLASPMRKVMIQDFPFEGWFDDRYEVALAQNEHEGMQVVVVPFDRDLEEVKVAVSPLRKNGESVPDGPQTAVSLVGHIMAHTPGSYSPGYEGWYPDPLLDFQQTCDIAQGEHVAFWLDVSTGSNSPPGLYQGTIQISDGSSVEPLNIQLDVLVWDFQLPQGTHLRNAFTYEQKFTKRLYPGSWSEELAAKYHDFLLEHRLNIDALYGRHERNVELLKDGAAKGMNAFNLFYLGDWRPEVLDEMLKQRVPALKEAGIYDLAYLYGFDEKGDSMYPIIRNLLGIAHDLYPDLETMTTAYDNTFGRDSGLRQEVDIWVPLTPRYNFDEAIKLRQEGKEMWWYTCIGPRHPFANWFVEYPAIEARLLMGAMSYKYQTGGFLYYMLNQWKFNEHPILWGPYTKWSAGNGKSPTRCFANGDGNVFAAGPNGPLSTIRMENIRDGLDDYEYFYALGQLTEQVRAMQPSERTKAFLKRADHLLSVPNHVVNTLDDFTYEPCELGDLRQAIAETVLDAKRVLQ